MSFLFEPVSAAIETLKYIKSASDKGPDPNRFVTRVPIDPGKWALSTAFKRRHNIWKWSHYMPAKVPRRTKGPHLGAKLKIIAPVGEKDSESDSSDEETKPKHLEAEDLSGTSLDTSKTTSVATSPQSTIYATAAALDKPVEADAKTQAQVDAKKISKTSLAVSELNLEDDDWPFFPVHEEEDFETEARRKAEMVPEQGVYFRSCDHFKVKAMRSVLKQIDTTEMKLAFKRMRDVEFKSIATALVMNFTVKRLDLTETGLTEKHMTYLNDLLANETSITDLILKDNNLEGRVFKRLFESIASRDIITYLDISGNCLRDKDVPKLALYIEASATLSYLLMARNKFTSKAGEPLGKIMTTASILELNVSANNLRGDGMIAFLNGVAKNTTLERLDVSWNGIGTECVRALSNVFKNSQSLTHVIVSATRLNGECLDLLATQGLAKNSLLHRLELKHNPLLTNDFISFFTKLYNNQVTGIKRVDLADYQVLDASMAPLLSQLFWEKGVDVRCGPLFAYSKQSEATEKVIERYRNDALAVVSRLNQVQQALLVKHFSALDIQESMESGVDILPTSFLGRFNDSCVTTRDLAVRVMREGSNPREVVKGVLQNAENLDAGTKKLATRFSLTRAETRKIQVLSHTD